VRVVRDGPSESRNGTVTLRYLFVIGLGLRSSAFLRSLVIFIAPKAWWRPPETGHDGVLLAGGF
jgi:hypothetical protein